MTNKEKLTELEGRLAALQADRMEMVSTLSGLHAEWGGVTAPIDWGRVARDYRAMASRVAKNPKIVERLESVVLDLGKLQTRASYHGGLVTSIDWIKSIVKDAIKELGA